MEKFGRDFKGVWIPKDVWLDDRLTFLDKVILIEVDSLDTEEGCHASNEYLAEFCKCSITKVSLAINKLIDLGLIELINFNGRKRILKSRLSKSERQTFKKLKADFQKVKGNKSNKTPNNIDYILSPLLFPPEVEKAVREWLDYKKEKGQSYKSKGLSMLLVKIKKMLDEKGARAVVEAIEYSISNNYAGIYEPRTKKQGGAESSFNTDEFFARALQKTYEKKE